MFGKQKTEETRVRVAEHRKILLFFSIIFTIYAVALLFVFGWIFINSFKTREQYLHSIWSLPKSFNFKNYAAVWRFESSTSFVDMFKNSVLLCTVMPTVGCFVTSFAAYVLAKFKFKSREFIYFLHILPMMVAIAGTQASTYLLLDAIGLADSFWGLLLMGSGGTGMNFLLLYGTYKNISDTYMEAAEIDGASDFRIYFQIMMPQAFGIIGTLWLFGFISTWNDYATINMFYFSHPTVAVGLEALRTEFIENDLEYPTYYAALVLSMLPIIILFILFQEQIMKLSLGGGIKG